MSSESMLKSTAEELRESLEAEHLMGKPFDSG